MLAYSFSSRSQVGSAVADAAPGDSGSAAFSACRASWAADVRCAMHAALLGEYRDWPLPATIDIRRRHAAVGRAIWEQLYEAVEGGSGGIPPLPICEHPDLARNLPHLLAFGHAVATLCHRRANGEPRLEPAVTRLGALFNALVCAMDRIWDAEREGVEPLVTLVTEEWFHIALEAAVASTQPEEWRLARRLGPAPTLASFVCRALDAYIAGLRDLAAACGRSGDLPDLAEAASRLLRAHRSSTAMLIGTTPPSPAVAATLREVGIGPFRMIALTALLASSSRSDLARRDVWEVATRLGEAFWQLDDLCDAFEDLEARAWSSLWLDMARGGADLLDESRRPRPEVLLARLRESRVADTVASGVVDALAVGNRVETLEMWSWAWSWTTD